MSSYDKCEEEIQIRLCHHLPNTVATKRYVDSMLNWGYATLSDIIDTYDLTEAEQEFLKLKYA